MSDPDEAEAAAPKKARVRGQSGIFLTRDQIVVTTLGRGQPESLSLPIDDGDIATPLARLLSDGTVGANATIGIDPRWLYVLVEQSTPTRDGPSASDVLSKHLGEPNGFAAGRSTLKIGGTPSTRTVGCPRHVADQLQLGLQAAERRGVQLVPTPDLVFRAARRLKKAPRRWVNHVRILPGDPDGIVLLVHRDEVVTWRLIEFRPGEDPWEIETAVLGLLSHAAEDLSITDISGAILHAGPDAADGTIDTGMADHLGSALCCPVVIAPAMVHDAGLSAELLARAAKSSGHGTDLLKDMHPERSMAASFPYATAASLLVTLAAEFFYLNGEVSQLETNVSALEVEVVEATTAADIQPAELADQRDRMVYESRTAHAYLVNRVPWWSILHALPGILSKDTRLELLEAHDEVVYPTDDGSSRRNTRSLLLSAEAILAPNETTPPEAARIAEALQREPFEAHFPKVGGSDIQLVEGSKGRRLAKITLLALPSRE